MAIILWYLLRVLWLNHHSFIFSLNIQAFIDFNDDSFCIFLLEVLKYKILICRRSSPKFSTVVFFCFLWYHEFVLKRTLFNIIQLFSIFPHNASNRSLEIITIFYSDIMNLCLFWEKELKEMFSVEKAFVDF